MEQIVALFFRGWIPLEPKINASTSVSAGCLAFLLRDKSFIVETQKKKKLVTFHPYCILRVSKCIHMLFLSADF